MKSFETTLCGINNSNIIEKIAKHCCSKQSINVYNINFSFELYNALLKKILFNIFAI